MRHFWGYLAIYLDGRHALDLGCSWEMIKLVYDSVGKCSFSQCVAKRLGVFKGAIFCTTCCSAASQHND